MHGKEKAENWETDEFLQNNGGWFGVVVINDFGHINKVKLHWALGLATFDGSTIPLFIQATHVHSAWPSLCGYGRWNKYWQWFRSALGEETASSA